MIAENPFSELKGISAKANKEKLFFVTREMATKVLDECPNNERRLIFALARYGGLRCPSELVGLRWRDVDWAGQRLTIHAPKTEHHDGGGVRVIPIFTEMREYLDQAWEDADDGAQFVIANPVYRDPKANLRTHFIRIVKRAGVEPWPKLFQNLRSTRETELAENYPLHVACAWIGNTKTVAIKHYLQVTDSHFAKATEMRSTLRTHWSDTDLHGATRSASNPEK